jgi:hypothetical protein
MFSRHLRCVLAVSAIGLTQGSLAWGESIAQNTVGFDQVAKADSLRRELPRRPQRRNASLLDWSTKVRQNLHRSVAAQLNQSPDYLAQQVRMELQQHFAVALAFAEQPMLLVSFNRANTILNARTGVEDWKYSQGYADAIRLVQNHAGRKAWTRYELGALQDKIESIEDVEEFRTVVQSVVITSKTSVHQRGK